MASIPRSSASTSPGLEGTSSKSRASVRRRRILPAAVMTEFPMKRSAGRWWRSRLGPVMGRSARPRGGGSLMAQFRPSRCSSRKNSLAAISRMSASSIRTEWWKHVLEYGRHINDLLGNPSLPSGTVIENPKTFLLLHEEPSTLKAAWQLMEIFNADKQSLTWLPGCLADWIMTAS